MSARARLLGLWSLLAAAACSGDDKPLTQIVVVVDSDLEVPGELDSLRIEVSGALNMPSAQAALRGGDLPRSLGLVHAGGPLGPVRVVARGFHEDSPVVERSAEVRFVQDKTLQLPLTLTRACAARASEPCNDGETCDDGACVPEAITSLPAFTGKLPAHPEAGAGAAAEGGGGAGGEDQGESGTGGTDSVQAGTGGSDAVAGEPAPNTAPTCEISQPADHASFYAGDSVTLSGSCADAETGTPGALVWSSSIQGMIGSAESAQFNAQVGEHSINLCATDATDASLQGCASTIVIDVQPLPGTSAKIESLKQAGKSATPFSSDTDIVVTGSATGAQPVMLTWTDSLLGSVGTGSPISLRLPAGRHALTLTVTDARSGTASALSSYFDVLDPGQTAPFASFSVNTALAVTGPAIALDADADNIFVVSSSGGASVQSTLYRLPISNPTPMTGSFTNVLTGATVTLRDVFAHPASQHAYLATSNGYVTCSTTSSGIDANTCVYSKDGTSILGTGEVNSIMRVTTPNDHKEYLVLGRPMGLATCDAADCANSNQYFKDAVNDLALAGDTLWIATATGLWSSDLAHGGGFSPKQLKDTPKMLSTLAAGSSGVWMGSPMGLARYDPASKTTTQWNMMSAVGSFQRLASNDVRALAIARVTPAGASVAHDVIWIATGMGVSRFDPSIPSFITLTKDDGLPSNSVRSVLVLPNGDKLFGTDMGMALYHGQ